jgi:hypothetical protein
LRELETHLIVVQRLRLVPPGTVDAVLYATEELAKMLYTMRQRVLANGDRLTASLKNQ